MPLLLALFIALASPALASPSFGDGVAKTALRYRDERPPLRVEACNGLIEDVLKDQGVDLRGDVRTLFAKMKEQGWVHRRKVPKPGDIVFFDHTYDKDRNGRQDDPLSHIAIVISVDDDGTVNMVHRGSKGIRPLTMNLHQPGQRNAADGKVLNSWLGQPGYAREGKRLSGELWRAFATPQGGPSFKPSARPASAPPVMAREAGRELPVALDDPALERVLRGRRLRARHLDGRSCYELWFLRNAVFARHGYPFSQPEAKELFGGIDRYKPRPELDQQGITSRLRRGDRANLQAIVERERRCR